MTTLPYGMRSRKVNKALANGWRKLLLMSY